MRCGRLCATGVAVAWWMGFAAGFLPSLPSSGVLRPCRPHHEQQQQQRSMCKRSGGGALHRRMAMDDELDIGIEVGEVDPVEAAKIKEPLEVLGCTMELIGAKKGVYTFKYNGLIKNKHGIEAWATSMIHEATGDDTCQVVTVTNRKRDSRDHYLY